MSFWNLKMLTKYGNFITKDGINLVFKVFSNPIIFNGAALSLCDGGRAVMVGFAPVGTSAKMEITRLVCCKK